MRPTGIPIRRRFLPGVLAALLAVLLAPLLAIPPQGASANGWEHAGIPWEALIAALRYDDPAVRMRAAHSLGHRRQKEAAPHLLAALARPEPDHGVRRRIYTALGLLRAPSAVPALLDCLDRESREELRGDCAWALGGFGAGRGASGGGHSSDNPDDNPDRERIRDRLIAAAGRGEHALVRLRAVDALGRFGDAAAVAALAALALGDEAAGARNLLRQRAVAALGATGHGDAAAPLLALLARVADTPGDGSGNGSQAASQALPVVQALAGLGAAAAREPLTALLGRARDPRLRSAIAVALAAIGGRDSSATLAGLLADPSPLVQLAAVRALGSRRSPDGGDSGDDSGARIADDSGDGRALAVAAYARALAAQLYASDSGARAVAGFVAEASLLDAALAALVALDAARGEDVLLTASRRRPAPRRTTADIVIANALYRVRRTAINGLGYTGSAAAAAFLAGPHGLGDPDPRLRAAAIRSIAVLGGPDAATAILPLLTGAAGSSDAPGSSDAEVRMAAARALGRLGDRRAVAPLIERLAGDGHAQVRRLAAEGLGYLADPAARPALRQAAGDASPAVRKAARFALTLLDRAAGDRR